MCGRFSIADPKAIQSAMKDLAIRIPEEPRYNIAPAQMVPVVLNDGKRELSMARWGLIPSWAKDISIGQKLFNARAETITENPSFRESFMKRRCLIFADGFYEWATVPGNPKRTPFRVTRNDESLFAFAGLWDVWHDPEGDSILSTTIITTTPNELMKSFHHRMPVILPNDRFNDWIVPGSVQPEELMSFLTQYPARLMKAYPVSANVNSAANDDLSCLEPLPATESNDLFGQSVR